MSLNLVDVRVRQRDYLQRIAQALVSRLNLRAVLRLILQASVDMLQGQAGLIALRGQDGRFTKMGEAIQEPKFWASYGIPPGLLDSFAPLVNDVPEFDAASEFTIPDLADTLRQIAQETGLLLRQVVALPMVLESELLGVIFIFRSHSVRFSPDERQILAGFADYAAIAVNNARLYETAVTERQRMDALLEVSGDGILVLNPDLTIERVNQALVTLTGWHHDRAVGRQHDEIIVWARQDSKCTFSQQVEAGWLDTPEPRPLYVQGELLRRNGSTVSVGITYAPLLTKSGKLLNIMAIVRDITRFRESDVLKDTFISVVSHELKTPVAIIKGYAETLQRPQARYNAALMDEMLSAIAEETDRLAQLVDDLLDASRLQAGGLPLKDVEDADLREIAQRVVDRYRPRTKIHQLLMSFPEDFPVIRGDPQRLEQVLDNYVSNAIKYSPQGGDIIISGETTPADVIVSVTDQGIGVPVEEQERIFDRFYRVESPETRAVSGTGLGLYLTRAIVRAHGGRCWVKSAPGQGSSFYVALPRQTGLVLWQREPKINLG